MRLHLLPLISLLGTGLSLAQAPQELLDAAIRHPGLYSQMCDVQIMPSPAPLSAFRQVAVGEAFLSEATLEALKKQRKPVLELISQRLEKVDLFAKPQPQGLDPKIKKDEEGNFESDGEPRGYDPATYSILTLRIIQDLDGVEAMPALLSFETRFHAALLKLEKDPTAPIPTVDGLDGANVAMEGLFNNEKGEPVDYDKLTEAQQRVFERRGKVFRATAAQRDMLAVMVKLMRKEGFEPMLNSPLEAEYGKLLKEQNQEDDELKKYRKTEDIPKDEQDNIKYDAVHGTAYYVWQPVQLPYTEEKRSMIRQLAGDFVKSKKTDAK
jgi:hypothetical protein